MNNLFSGNHLAGAPADSGESIDFGESAIRWIGFRIPDIEAGEEHSLAGVADTFEDLVELYPSIKENGVAIEVYFDLYEDNIIMDPNHPDHGVFDTIVRGEKYEGSEAGFKEIAGGESWWDLLDFAHYDIEKLGIPTPEIAL